MRRPNFSVRCGQSNEHLGKPGVEACQGEILDQFVVFGETRLNGRHDHGAEVVILGELATKRAGRDERPRQFGFRAPSSP